MVIARRWLVRGAAGLGATAVALTGCQTYPAGFGGMTLPSGQYLKHYPQYFPPDPPFPLQQEMNSMQDPEGLRRGGPGGAPLPGPLPAPGQFGPPAPAGGAPVPNPQGSAPAGTPPG